MNGRVARRCTRVGAVLLAALALCACRHEAAGEVPLIERTISFTDRFYDVQALGKDAAIVVGYGGKILVTSDGGRHWERRQSGVDAALYSVDLPDRVHGWIVGQDGIVLRTDDGGHTWHRQDAHATFTERDGSVHPVYLFSIFALDSNRAWAVGDRSLLTSTTDGGKTWRARVVPMTEEMGGGEALAAAEPVFYDVQFVDAQHGWIVGEFGKIMYTEDGGESWVEQEKSLMSEGIFDILDIPTMFGVHMLDRWNGATAGLEGHIARTTDGGATWRFDKMKVDVPLFDPLYEPYLFPDGSGWAVGGAGEVVVRRPGEDAWHRADLGQDVHTWLRGIDFYDRDHGWIVGGYGLIFRTTDGGKTWLPASFG